MIDQIILAAALFIGPIPTQQQQMQAVNVSAARQARELPASWKAFQACVAQRESSGRWDAQNPVSSAQGRYQYLDSQWRSGGAWNVWKRLIRHGYDRQTADRVRHRLTATPIKRWRPVYQDILFAETLLSGKGQGWRHWHHPGSRCNSLVPK